MRFRSVMIALAGLVAALASCRKDPPLAPVVQGAAGPGISLDLDALPFPKLSDYGFFTGRLADMQPAPGVLPYRPITPVFGDYAEKFRFVWMPAGQEARYVSDDQALDFPEGAILIKAAYYPRVLPNLERMLLDTRLMIRKGGTWIFAEYRWNEEQTDAELDMEGSNVPLTWVDDAGQGHDEIFRIPSAGECLSCHKHYNEPTVIGPKPQNLDIQYPYSGGSMNQLAKWTAEGYLAMGYPSGIDRVARWDDPDETLERRVRAYLDMNCAHCHYDGGFCSYRPMRFAWHQTTDPANLGICIPPEDPFAPGVNYIVNAGNPLRSMLYYRLSSTEEAERMPLFERTVRHEEAIQLVGDWINSLAPNCP